MTKPNIKEIEWAISDLENEETSESKYILLSALYTCRDHMLRDTRQEPFIAAYSQAAAPVSERLASYGDSDFLRAVEGKDPADAWAVIDELMDTLQVVNPRAYGSVMRKLERI